MNQPFHVRHARSLQAGIQVGRGVDSRLKNCGNDKTASLVDRFIGATDRPTAADPVLRVRRFRWLVPRRTAPLLDQALGLQAFQLHLGMIGKGHRSGDGVVACLLGDEPVHRLADTPVCRMALR